MTEERSPRLFAPQHGRIHHPANEQWPFRRLLSKRCVEPPKSLG
jgi:hypothetical protein